MSDNHENFQNGTGSESGSYPQSTSSPASYTYSTNSSQTPQSYTWNSQTGEYRSGPYTPVYGAPGTPPPGLNGRKKRRGTPFGVKLVVVLLCCVLTSAATLGVFVWMIQNGVVDIQTTGGNAAFTIARVVDGNTKETDSTISEMSDQDIAEKVIPSVVCIQNYQITQQYGFSTASSESGDVSPAGEGSGIVFSEDGYIVTNAHVVDGATSLKVILYDGSTHEAELIGSDELTDLAVIKIEAGGGVSETAVLPADFGSSEDMRVADKVMAIGNPGGYELSSSVTIGYVSALNRAITNSSTGYTMEFIQTDAAINPGNSGGALVNTYGQVIGINSAKISATGYEGLGFAIPTDTAQPIISDLIQYGYVKDRAMLGISGQYIDSLTGRFYGLPQGEYVGELTTQEAKDSGLRAGDVIMSIDGTELASETMIRTVINTKKPGETVELEVYRASSGKTLTITLTLSEYSGG